MNIRDIAFPFIAKIFPTHLIADSPFLESTWRVLFYSFSPKAPFAMRAKHYTVFARPDRTSHTRAIIRRGNWEQLETKLFVACLNSYKNFKNFTVLDVGANFGHYSLVSSNLLKPDNLILAFEPHPYQIEILKENIKLQPNKNIRPVRCGVSDEEGCLELHSDSDNPGGHSFYKSTVRRQGQVHEVPVVTVDNYLDKLDVAKAPKLIKIDVEGHELYVINGAAKTIEAHRPIVFCEVSASNMCREPESPITILENFSQWNYSPVWIDKKRSGYFLKSYDQLKNSFMKNPGQQMDICFVPKEAIDDLKEYESIRIYEQY